MRITKSYLRRVIMEELQKEEVTTSVPYTHPTNAPRGPIFSSLFNQVADEAIIDGLKEFDILAKMYNKDPSTFITALEQKQIKDLVRIPADIYTKYVKNKRIQPYLGNTITPSLAKILDNLKKDTGTVNTFIQKINQYDVNPNLYPLRGYIDN